MKKEELENKVYSIYELNHGQPSHFWDDLSKSFTYDKNRATLHTLLEAKRLKDELAKLRIDNYQASGENYKELHIGNLFEKHILQDMTISKELELLKAKGVLKVKLDGFLTDIDEVMKLHTPALSRKDIGDYQSIEIQR